MNMGSWTIGRKVAAGFALVVFLTVLVAAVGVGALTSAVSAKDEVLATSADNLNIAARLSAALEGQVASIRGYLLTGGAQHRRDYEANRGTLAAALERFAQKQHVDREDAILQELRATEAAYDAAATRVLASYDGGAGPEAIQKAFEAELEPRHGVMNRLLTELVALEQRRVETSTAEAASASDSAVILLILVAAVAVVVAAGAGFLIAGGLTKQIGSAVQHIQSSAAELQAAAGEQVTGVKEQSTAMTEITTTISELLATSKQIADGAQRVSTIAAETGGASRQGDVGVRQTGDAFGNIKRQMDLVVGHVLELGKKSQLIGGILEIINELSEQTNILAINATIEAAGAGEAGRRFGVVADEIRKLADRVAGSTREIRVLVDDIRAAVNTTVMVSEGGAKAVDGGAQQMGSLAASFSRILGLVGTTTEASREIELSTKQQATAVEQVKVAVANVAQATRETEASSSQTLQTAGQLTSLSTELRRLIQRG